MVQLDAVRDVARRLDRLGLPWMLVGSYASGYYGEPRFTKDLDVVVAYAADDADAIAAAFADAYYADPNMLREALAHGTLANFIHNQTLYKVDLCPLKDDEYSRLALQRRRRVDFDGFEVWIATAEDTVLAKLAWNRMTPSELQLRDVLDILRVRQELDHTYLRLWAERLGLRDDLEQVWAEARGT